MRFAKYSLLNMDQIGLWYLLLSVVGFNHICSVWLGKEFEIHH